MRAAGWQQKLQVFRLRPDGALDPDFGVGGLVHNQRRQRAQPGYSVIVDPDGRIVVAGRSYQGGTLSLLLVRLNQTAHSMRRSARAGLSFRPELDRLRRLPGAHRPGCRWWLPRDGTSRNHASEPELQCDRHHGHRRSRCRVRYRRSRGGADLRCGDGQGYRQSARLWRSRPTGACCWVARRADADEAYLSRLLANGAADPSFATVAAPSSGAVGHGTGCRFERFDFHGWRRPNRLLGRHGRTDAGQRYVRHIVRSCGRATVDLNARRAAVSIRQRHEGDGQRRARLGRQFLRVRLLRRRIRGPTARQCRWRQPRRSRHEAATGSRNRAGWAGRAVGAPDGRQSWCRRRDVLHP